MPYHPNNLSLQPYASWRVIVLAWAGKLLGVQFHISGIPFGAPYRPEINGECDARDAWGEV